MGRNAEGRDGDGGLPDPLDRGRDSERHDDRRAESVGFVHLADKVPSATGGGHVARPTSRTRPSPRTRPDAGIPATVRRLGRIHHVALVVRSIADSLSLWRDALGLPLESVMDIEQDRVRIAFLTSGESKIELVQPTDDQTGVARFLADKGEGFHHVCFEVDNLAETLLRLEIEGLTSFRDRVVLDFEGLDLFAITGPTAAHG